MIKRLLPKSHFARHVSVLAGGTVAGRLIVVAASPILTRLYSPGDFGLLAVFVGLVATVSVVASLRYQLAIPLAETDGEAASVTTLSALIVFLVTSLTTVTVILWGRQIAQVLNAPALVKHIWLVPVGTLLIGTYQILNYWAIRTRSFSAIARTTLTQAIGSVVMQVGGFKLGPAALLFGQVTGQAAGNTNLILGTLRPYRQLFKKVSRGDLSKAAVRWRRFPLYDTWSAALNTAGTQLPALLFASLFAPAAAGVYMLADRVLQTPMGVLGGAVSQVFFSRSAQALRDGELAALVATIHSRLAQIAMPPTIILILSGPDLFALVFGDQWREAGRFAQWMAPWVYMVFVTSPLSQLFSVLEKQAQGLVFNTVLFTTRTGGLLLGASRGDLMLAVALFSVAGTLCWLVFLIWIIRSSGNSWTTLIVPNVNTFTVSLLLSSPLLFQRITQSGFTMWMGTLSLSVLLMLAYYGYLWRIKST